MFKGFPAGGQNGERGYILTFVIAYIRVSFFSCKVKISIITMQSVISGFPT